MDSCGKRLGAAMAAVLLLVCLNIVLVVTGVADGVYQPLSGMRHTDNPLNTESPAGRLAGADGEQECVYAGALRQRLPLYTPARNSIAGYPRHIQSC